MMTKIFFHEKFLAGTIFLCSFGLAGAIAYAQTSSDSSSIQLKKDPTSGFFTLTIRASSGIKEFALRPPKKSSYGGGLNSCPTTFNSDNVSFADPDDFTPKMEATITDCTGNSIDFDLVASKDGLINGKSVASPENPSTSPASAQTNVAPKSTILANVQFPVLELGNCQSEVECVSYCNDANHASACLDFAQKNKIITPENAQSRKKLANITNGPGGCNSQKSCEAYCSDISNLDECFAFAQKNNLLPEQDLAKIGKLKTAIAAGAKLPGGCNNQKSCEAYCNNADHADECLNFGEQSGFLSADEIQQYRKFAELQKSGETPGKCSSKDACDAYCNNPDNADECIVFAEKAGFLSGQDLEQAKKILPLIKAGKTPGGCRTKQQCDTYCSDESHTDECVAFGLQAGVISQQDAEVIKKTGGKGPGGCHGKEECQAYCSQNQQECMNWAKDNGLQGQFSGPGGCRNQDECQAYCKDYPQECQGFSPPDGGSTGGPGNHGGGGIQHDGLTECGIVNGATAAYVCGINGKSKGVQTGVGVETTYFNECHAKNAGAEIIHTGACIRAGGPDNPCSNIAHPVCGTDGNSWVHECYAKENGAEVKHEGVCTNEDRGANSGGSSGGGSEFSGGPGGCKSKEECAAYCKDHLQECQNFGPGGNRAPSAIPNQPPMNVPVPTNYGGPGGCKTATECQTYCTQNYTDPACQKFMPSQPSSLLPPSTFFSAVIAPLIEVLKQTF